MKRIGGDDDPEIEETEVNGQFRVKTYTIDTTSPSCNCEDFSKTGWPCKHMLSLISSGYIQWNNLPEEYTNLPCFVLDNMETLPEDGREDVDNGI
jgi:hypothetical protein